MRENIHYSKTISSKILPYIEEAISVLESINIPVTEEITFYTEKNVNHKIKLYGSTSSVLVSETSDWTTGDYPNITLSKKKYYITIKNKIIEDKDLCINVIIHELLHVKSRLNGENEGHGIQWNTLADLVSQNTMYNICRFNTVNPVKEMNSFFSLTREEQKTLLEKMKAENNPELFDKSVSIYFSLLDTSLKNDFTFYFIENRVIKDKDFTLLPLKELLPYVMLNDRIICKLVNRYLIGNYDYTIDTPTKSSRFVSILELPNSYDDTKELSNLIRIVNSHNEQRFMYA